MKFNIGDLVWVKWPNQPEYADEVIRDWGCGCDDHPDAGTYGINSFLCICGYLLRLRREDYQQHEALGSIDSIFEKTSQPEVNNSYEMQENKA